jgi:tetratricopeptide (TPR) repeat protein
MMSSHLLYASNLFGATLLLVNVGCGSLAVSKEVHLERGNKFAKEGNVIDASLEYRKALQKDPRYGEALLRLGELFSKQAKHQEAFGALSQAAEIMPKSEEVQIALGNTAFSAFITSPERPLVYYQAVEKVSKRLLASSPTSFGGLRLHGLLLMVDSKSNEAIETFRKALQAKPYDPEVVSILIQNLLIEKRDDEAETLGREALPHVKQYGPLYDSLYGIYLRSGRLADAEEILKTKVSNNPGQELFMVQLAEHYQSHKREQDVRTVVERLTADPKLYPNGRLSAGDFYRRTGQFDEAVLQFEKGLAIGDRNRKVYLERLAGVRMEQGRTQDAIRILDTILKESPNDSAAQSARASMRMATGSPEEMALGLETFKALAKQSPDDEEVRLLLARAYRTLGQTNEARNSLLDLLKKNPRHREAVREMADLAIRAARADEALQYAERLVESQPKDVSSRLVRTAAWALQRRFGEVRTELRTIAQEYPNLPEVQLQLATLAMEERNFGEAERILLSLRRADQDSMPALRRLVALYTLVGRPQQAVILAQEQITRSASPEARALLVSAAAQAGNLELALTTAKQLSMDFPKNPDHWGSSGEIYARQGLHDNSIASFRKAQQAEPENPIWSARLGSALGMAGRYTEAAAAYRESLKLSPEDPLLMNNLAWHLAMAGTNLEEALVLSQSAKRRAPENVAYADTLGLVYLRLKKLDNARQTAQNVVTKEPSNPEWRSSLASILIAQGETQPAKAELEKALQLHPSPALEKELRVKLRSLQ